MTGSGVTVVKMHNRSAGQRLQWLWCIVRVGFREQHNHADRMPVEGGQCAPLVGPGGALQPQGAEASCPGRSSMTGGIVWKIQCVRPRLEANDVCYIVALQCHIATQRGKTRQQGLPKLTARQAHWHAPSTVYMTPRTREWR